MVQSAPWYTSILLSLGLTILFCRHPLFRFILASSMQGKFVFCSKYEGILSLLEQQLQKQPCTFGNIDPCALRTIRYDEYIKNKFGTEVKRHECESCIDHQTKSLFQCKKGIESKLGTISVYSSCCCVFLCFPLYAHVRRADRIQGLYGASGHRGQQMGRLEAL